MPGPLVSVVIPSYNYARYIGQTIESALGQSYQPVEVVVVDDGSTDDSLAVVARFGDRVRLFQQKNAGPSRARNLGIEHSKGQFVAFLDSDDLWSPEKIAKQMEKMRDPRVGLVNCGIEYIDAQSRPMWVSLEGVEGKILRAHARFRERTVGPPSAVLARRACFDKVGMFDPALSMSADWDMWRRIGSSYDVAMVREPLMKYRVHNAALHHNVDLLARDMVYAFDRMFDDPRSAEIQDERRACYANMYATLCGSYLHKGHWKKAMHFAVRSLKERPDRLLVHTLGIPVRRIKRWAFGSPPA